MPEKLLSREELLETLRHEGHLPAGPAGPEVEGVSSGQREESPRDPWFIQGLMGCGAWLAAGFLISLLFALNLFRKGMEIPLGILLIIKPNNMISTTPRQQTDRITKKTANYPIVIAPGHGHLGQATTHYSANLTSKMS